MSMLYVSKNYAVHMSPIADRNICALVDGKYGVFPHLRYDVYRDGQFLAWFEEPAGTNPQDLIDQVASR